MTWSCVDAFSGAGGLALGLEGVGFRILYSFDKDETCIETIRANIELNERSAAAVGIEDLLGGELLRRLGLEPGELDLLAGGPPCQGFSTQRGGEDEDLRNALVTDYGQLVVEVRPRVVLMENVPGLGGRRGSAILAALRATLEDAGYRLQETVLDAQDFGVPQRRRRIFLVGFREDLDVALGFKWPVPLRERKTVREAIGHLPPPPDGGRPHPSIPNHRADNLSDLNKARLRALGEGQSRVDLPEHLLAACHLRSADLIGHRNVYGRMEWDSVSPTITARFDSFTRGKFGHPDQLRTVSLREGALLQGFPEDFVFVGTKVEVARQIGNAVPPPLARAVGSSIAASLASIRQPATSGS